MPLSFIGTRAKNRRIAVIAGTTCAASVLATGGASAYFTTTGDGSGTAKVGVGSTILSVEATVTTGLLWPSNTYKGDLHFTLSAPVNAHVTGIAKDPARSITVTGGIGGPGAACAGSVVTVTPAVLNVNLTANAPFTTSAPAVVQMAFTAPSSCQTASFQIPVIVTGSAI
jgi:hypothetical protein